MIPLPFSITLLSVVTLLVFLGFAERVLDRMRLDDKTAIVLLAMLIASHFLPAVQITRHIAINLGAFVPLGVALYLLITTSKKERLHALVISVVAALILWLTDRLFSLEPGGFIFDIDPLFIPGILAGLISYITTRSRRSAFIGAVLSVMLVDLLATVNISLDGLPQQIVLGGGGIFDALLINGVLAVGIAEIIGEINERIQRGPAKIKNNEDGEGNS